MLTRSAWAGMHRFGAALWSGDTMSKWEVLRTSIPAGLGVQMSGIAWWTTDIGGYGGGNPSDPVFRELIVRWFQFGFACPIFRQHGARPTEPWLLGNTSLAAVVKVIQLRDKFRPYIMAQMHRVSLTGQPVNRPLFWDFPADEGAWTAAGQFMFGPDYMVAPVTGMGNRTKTLYLPRGANFVHYFSNATYAGGQVVTVPAPLDEFPLFRVIRG